MEDLCLLHDVYVVLLVVFCGFLWGLCVEALCVEALCGPRGGVSTPVGTVGVTVGDGITTDSRHCARRISGLD